MKISHSFYAMLILFLIFFNSLIGAPFITSVTPDVGPSQGGTSVTIIGSGFTGATAVTFGPRLATSFIVNSDTSITAIAPPGVPGNINIQVTTGAGTSPLTFSDLYTYTGDWFAYVTDIATGSVYPIDLATGTIGTPIPTGSGPFFLAITPDGQTAFVSNQNQATVSAIDLATNTVTTNFNAFGPTGIAVTPDGQLLILLT